MALSDTRHDQMFPVLTTAQIAVAKRFAAGLPTTFGAGAVLFHVGQREVPAFLVLQGSVEISRGASVAAAGSLLTTAGVGQITGEVAQLAGRPALADGRAGPDGCEVVAFDAPHLRAMLIGSAELGELMMRAFILRRTAMIADGRAGSVLLGRRHSHALTRIEGFLSRNGYPYTVLDAEADGAELVERLGLQEADLPVVICPGGAVLKHPSDSEVGSSLGLAPDLDPNRLYDVAVVGAGPAGLATAVYAASEGLSVLVLDSRAFGGQAGASARIENYLGFPTGITGMALTARAYTQAQKFGAEIAIPMEVESLDCGGDRRRAGDPFGLTIKGAGRVQARTVVIASGARYRRPAIDNLADFDGAGVSYWASPIEAKICSGEEVALVGAGNSAGQAVAFLAPHVKRLHLVVRGSGLEASMSRYLIDRIAALPNVEIQTRTEVVALSGNPTDRLDRGKFPPPRHWCDLGGCIATPVPVHRRRSEYGLAEGLYCRDRSEGIRDHRRRGHRRGMARRASAALGLGNQRSRRLRHRRRACGLDEAGRRGRRRRRPGRGSAAWSPRRTELTGGLRSRVSRASCGGAAAARLPAAPGAPPCRT